VVAPSPGRKCLGSVSHPPEAASLSAAAAIKDLECEDLLEEYILEMKSQNLPIQEKMIQDALVVEGKNCHRGVRNPDCSQSCFSEQGNSGWSLRDKMLGNN
jgi:hypothetical protein